MIDSLLDIWAGWSVSVSIRQWRNLKILDAQMQTKAVMDWLDILIHTHDIYS